jgi:hypothetical protein
MISQCIDRTLIRYHAVNFSDIVRLKITVFEYIYNYVVLQLYCMLEQVFLIFELGIQTKLS